MTAILEDGDYCFGPRGEFREAEGKEAVIQEILIRLKARRGAFPLDPALGSTLWRLDPATAGEDELAAVVAEALRPMRDVALVGTGRSLDAANGRLTVSVHLLVGGEETSLNLKGFA